MPDVCEAPPRFRDDKSWWRFSDLLPLLPGEAPVTLGDVISPILDLQIEGVRAHGKLDFISPTGSFKDRSASMIVTRLLHWRISHCAVDSSGNAGIATAAYCARAGIKCSVYVPAHTNEGKVRLMREYGADVHIVEGNREQATGAALKKSEETFYGGQTRSPFFEVGGFLWAWEVWDALGRLPDSVVLPVGSGSLLLGASRGFRTIHRMTRSGTQPRIYAVQAEACAPLAQAIDRGLAAIDPDWQWRQTVAEGIATTRPLRSETMLKTIRASGGTCVTLTDSEITRAQSCLAQRGLCVEPTGAVGVAGMIRLHASGEWVPDELVIAPLTGSGQKSIASAALEGGR